jgi:hypothetical protein
MGFFPLGDGYYFIFLSYHGQKVSSPRSWEGRNLSKEEARISEND